VAAVIDSINHQPAGYKPPGRHYCRLLQPLCFNQ